MPHCYINIQVTDNLQEGMGFFFFFTVQVTSIQAVENPVEGSTGSHLMGENVKT